MKYLLHSKDTNISGASNEHEEVTQKPMLLKEYGGNAL